MRNEQQLRKRKEEIGQLLLLIEKYKVLISQITRNSLKAQITNITWLLEEDLE